jgi:1-phosphatidylinositol-4-phosphate 5-kinase
MFFCGNGEFVVKTILKMEFETLHEILNSYVTHLINTPESLLVRFLGCHSLKMYNQIFHFVVMKNIFPPSAIINTRYDIKGSWINRNGGVVPPGKKIFCRHCGELFISGTERDVRRNTCPDIVGTHEANFTLKDNDFTTKIRLRPEDSYTMIETLHKDSDALCAMGITDYSMLIGIRNLQYTVDPERVISKRFVIHSLCPPHSPFPTPPSLSLLLSPSIFLLHGSHHLRLLVPFPSCDW